MSTTTDSTTAEAVRYELMVIVAPNIGETAINKRVETLKKTITDFGGEISFEDVWGLRELAYSIGKHDQGYYIVMDVSLDPKHIKELDRILRLEVEVLRHLLMKLPALYQPKTLAAMEAEHAAEAVKQAEVKAEADAKKTRIPLRKPAEVRAETPKAVKAEPVAEEAPKKSIKKKEESKKELEDIDAKLDSILSNPDINF